MCGYFIDVGFLVMVYICLKEKVFDLLDKGVSWVDMFKVVVVGSDVIFLIVGFFKDVCEVIFGLVGVFVGC